MPSAATVDLEPLLAPVSSDLPAGEDLRWDPSFEAIRRARRPDADPAAAPDYALVARETTSAIARRSKDLRLAAYLTEALTHLHGFPGLRDGLRLVAELLSRFWEDLHPRLDAQDADADLEVRAAVVDWLTDADRGAQLPRVVRLLPLLKSRDGASLSYFDWKTKIAPRRASDRAAAPHAEGEGGQWAERFERCLAETSVEDLQALHGDLRECARQLLLLSDVVLGRFGFSGPDTAPLARALTDCGRCVEQCLATKRR